VNELDIITDMVEEKLVKGNFRWLANFNEIHKDYTISELTFPIYASGGLQERGFFLSRIFSALVTPKYKIHFLFYPSSQAIDPKQLRRLIIACKSKFGSEDWIFLGLVQSQPLGKDFEEAVKSIADNTVGVAAYSLSSKEAVSSENVLGKGLNKQLRLTETKFEAFDLPNYLKSFTIVFFLSMLTVAMIALSGAREVLSNMPLILLFATGLSLIAGYSIYKNRYHATLSMDNKGFQLKQGNKTKDEKWSKYTDVTIYITPKHETCLRLYAKEERFDLPLSRVGMSRKETYNMIKKIIKRK
jgi:hypothetical protein